MSSPVKKIERQHFEISIDLSAEDNLALLSPPFHNSKTIGQNDNGLMIKSITSHESLLNSLHKSQTLRSNTAKVAFSDSSSLQLILDILRLDKKLRTNTHIQILIQYFKKLQVFRDLLENDMDAYKHLTVSVDVKEYASGQDIIIEGDSGDTFFIILEGQIDVLKAQMIPVGTNLSKVDEKDLDEDERQVYQDMKVKTYFEAFKEHYSFMHWSGMDISKDEVAFMLGIEYEDMSLDPKQFAKPMTY